MGTQLNLEFICVRGLSTRVLFKALFQGEIRAPRRSERVLLPRHIPASSGLTQCTD